MKMKRKKNLNCSTGFSETGKIQLSYQLGRGYWDFGDLSAQRGGFDLPKKTVRSTGTVIFFFQIKMKFSFDVKVIFKVVGNMHTNS